MNLVHKSARILVYQKGDLFYIINNNPKYNVIVTMILQKVEPRMAVYAQTLTKYYQPQGVDYSHHVTRLVINQNILTIMDQKFNDGTSRWLVKHYKMDDGYIIPKIWNDAHNQPELYFVEAMV